jgi:hypothetical protein
MLTFARVRGIKRRTRVSIEISRTQLTIITNFIVHASVAYTTRGPITKFVQILIKVTNQCMTIAITTSALVGSIVLRRFPWSIVIQ